MPLDQLEALGVKLDAATNPTQSPESLEEQQRQLRIAELENKQRFWQWLIVAAIAVLVIETWLASAVAQRVSQADAETDQT